MAKEIWKKIPGWPGYAASNKGRIKSLERRLPHNFYADVMMLWKEKILKPGSWKSGHLFVVLPGQKCESVHRLVARTFIGPPPFRGALVCHKDDDPKHNRPKNLKWGTQKQNMADAKKNGKELGGYRPKGSHRVGGVFVC